MFYDDGVMVKIAEIEDLEEMERNQWPNDSKKDIQDKSKGDSFSKGFAVLQTTWFVSQCIARAVAGLVITELELATLAFAVLNGILYFFWWNKPLDVSCPIPIYRRNITYAFPREELRSYTGDRRECELLSAPFFALRYFFETTLFHIGNEYWPTLSMRSIHRQNLGVPPLSVPTFYAPSILREDRARLIAVGIGVLFGGIHCIAWSFGFPSVAEQCIWRISAVNITVIPIIIASLIVTIKFHAPVIIRKYTIIACIVVYLISRSALLILPVIALRSLSPASLVEFKWSVYIPHV